MIKSVVSRILIFASLAMLLLAGALWLSQSYAEASSVQTARHFESQDANVPDLSNEEAVVEIASLTLGSNAPGLEIVETPESILANTRAKVDAASDLASERYFERALETLASVHVSRQNDYSVRFLEARILSWSGQHGLAEHAFQTLQSEYPENLDVLVSYGYLQVYQRHFMQAERVFAEVLSVNPDYVDAKNGLDRARRAQQAINAQ